ncbi:MAG: hypothetical protein IPL61_08730 [Myxococcales bacterium]|nr:hypothetical protein [Myxococcales bacterium]
MRRSWSLWLLVAAFAVAAPRAATAGGPRPRVAQAPSKVDVAVAAVARAQRTLTGLAGERAASTRRYEAELGEIDQLKRQKASWRRDRALRSKLAASLETAKALTALADQVRRADGELARAKAAAVVAFDRALATAPPALRAELERRRAAYAAPVPTKKIVLPDDALDPLADPEELDDQVAALREAEAALAGEVARLDKRAHKFDEAAELRRQHERAEAMALTEDDDVRRVAVRAGGAFANVDSGAAAPTDGVTTEGPSGRELATALSAVVDARTVDVLRQSDRSNDPRTWAAAARQAKDAVATRLDTLRKRRQAIEARARELRRP